MAEVNRVRTIGADKAPMVHLVDNHDEAYHLWRRAGASGRTLVHVDAHHDMAWLDHVGLIDIGNYVCQAMRDGVVNEVVWVVPDASWATRSGRSVLRRHLNTLVKHYPGKTGPIQISDRQLSTRLLEVPVTICALDSLPEIKPTILLDIDVDFFTLPRVEFLRDDRPGETPWRWPAEFLSALRRKHLNTDFVTIAYSVAGGYVPMKWKYLGDELALEWQSGSADSERAKEGFRLLRNAALAQGSSHSAEAIADLRQAAILVSKSAAPHLNLALLHLSAGDVSQAKDEFLLAVKADASCRGPHASRGFVCLSEGRNDEAHREFRQILALDPHNPFGLLGLGRIAVQRRQWNDAEHFLRAAIAVEPRLIDAHRYLGDTLIRLRRDKEAAVAYSRSLKLAYSGPS